MPSWVMVPVPQEHVQDVMEFVIRSIARASVQEWDEASMEEFFAGIDEPSRALCSVVARAALSGKELSDQQAADFVQLTLRETYGIQREVNNGARALERHTLIGASVVEEALPNGRLREKRIFTMSTPLAELVRSAERTTDALESAGG